MARVVRQDDERGSHRTQDIAALPPARLTRYLQGVEDFFAVDAE